MMENSYHGNEDDGYNCGQWFEQPNWNEPLFNDRGEEEEHFGDVSPVNLDFIDSPIYDSSIYNRSIDDSPIDDYTNAFAYLDLIISTPLTIENKAKVNVIVQELKEDWERLHSPVAPRKKRGRPTKGGPNAASKRHRSKAQKKIEAIRKASKQGFADLQSIGNRNTDLIKLKEKLELLAEYHKKRHISPEGLSESNKNTLYQRNYRESQKKKLKEFHGIINMIKNGRFNFEPYNPTDIEKIQEVFTHLITSIQDFDI